MADISSATAPHAEDVAKRGGVETSTHGGDEEMIAEIGRRLWRAMRCSGRALRNLNGDLMQASECFWLAGRVSVPRSGPMAWVPSLDGYRLIGSYAPEPGQPADAGGNPAHRRFPGE